jgi:Zn-dependent M28 family amino/carboxypeptidase
MRTLKMRIIHSHEVESFDSVSKINDLLTTISENQLREWVKQIAIPRHFQAEPKQNHAIADWLLSTFAEFGCQVETQGPFHNVIALPPAPLQNVVLVGAHLDSVPESPGADDNASALAAMLGCAAACTLFRPQPAVMFVAFNREEEGFLGSKDFVETFLEKSELKVGCAHILEMVGYASTIPGSQKLPTGLPIKLNDKGDFLGLLANQQSSPAMELILRCAKGYTEKFPVTGLQVSAGAERAFPVLARSDHVPFWIREVPAVMWTDTAEFRNPNYHRETDTPETLDYGFLLKVTRLLTASVLHETNNEPT